MLPCPLPPHLFHLLRYHRPLAHKLASEQPHAHRPCSTHTHHYNQLLLVHDKETKKQGKDVIDGPWTESSLTYDPLLAFFLPLLSTQTAASRTAKNFDHLLSMIKTFQSLLCVKAYTNMQDKEEFDYNGFAPFTPSAMQFSPFAFFS